MEIYIQHHGVKGMKWGVRKEIARSTSEGLNESSRLASTVGSRIGASKKTKANTSKMSDEELRRRINRMNMERQYANLNPSKAKKGAAFAATALSVMGSVASIAAAGFGVAVAIKELKG